MIKPGMTPWTPQEEALMRRLYPCTHTAALAARLGRTQARVYAKAHHMGLKKGDAFLATSASGRILKGGRLSVATQFKPGQKAWNTGMKGLLLSPETTFKPGMRNGEAARRWVPVGSYRMNSDGYLDQKISDISGAPQHRNWKAAHRIVWERAHGPVPPGHAVVFRPGRRTTDPALITDDALELVTRQELMRRNSIGNLPPEIRELHQMRGTLNRAITMKRKEKQA